jgi:RimJ/RimL family protein N-acetyltransferase
LKIQIRKFDERKDTRIIEYQTDRTIIHTAGGQMSLPLNQSDFSDIFTSGCIWIALEDDKVIGAILFSRNDKGNLPCAAIYGIRVDEPYRRRGIGGILLQKADMFARTNGIDRITLQTSSENIASLTLCKKAGYTVTENSGDKLLLVKKMRFR